MDIEQLIRQRAEERGVNPDVAVSIAKAESSMIPGAKNPKSSARGLFQVTNDTWKEHGGDPKKRGDINEDIRVGLEVIARNTRSMRDVLGQEPQPRHIYAAHFFGPTGARRMLSADPNAQVAKVMSSQVMRANKEMLEGRTVAQALQELGRKVGDVEPKQEGVAQRGTVVTDPVTGELRRVPSVARPVDGGYREDPANPPVISRAIEATRDLGPGYQAALALSYLADTEESSDDENDASIVEREAAQEVATMTAPRSNAAQMLANMEFGFAPVVTQRQPQQQPPQQQQAPVRMREGGEVADPYAQLMQGAPRTRVSPGQFVRGGFDTAAGMLKGATQAAAGTFGDIESLVRMGVGSERGAVLPTTDDVKRTLDRFAPLNLPTAEGTDGRTAAEYFGEFMSPAAATRPLVRGAQAMGEGAVEGFRRAEAALEEPVGRILDRGGMSAEMLKAFGSPPSYAIRPPGGNVFPEQIEKIVAGPDVQRTLSNLPADRIDDVTEFLATKGRKYFQKDYASTKDPLYDALKEGRILPLTDTTQFRGYMIDAAREGNPQALEDLARNYDMAVEPTIITRPMPEGGSRADQLVQENEIIARLTRNLQEAPGAVLPMERRVPERYDLLRLQENVERSHLGRSLTPEELRSVERGDPFYKLDKTYAIPTFMRPDSIAKELAEIPADRLKNMSYPEAVIAINQPARFRADWGAAVKRAEQGKDVPKDVKMFGLSPEPVAKGDRGAWHQLRDPRSTQMESAFMGHSVKDYFQGSESYGLGGPEAFRSGRAKVYSLRDSKGNPRVTVEVLDTPEGMEVTQVKGRYNAGPRESEVNDVFKLFDELNTGGKLRNIRRELYLPNEKAPPDALTGGTEWKTLYDEYRQTKQ